MILAKCIGEHYIILSICFVIFVFIAYIFVLNFIYNLFLKKNKDYKIWFISFIIYFLIMFVIMLIIWPGHWVWDEFNIFDATAKINIYTWQSYITLVYYSICIMFFPSPVSIVLIQIVVLSFITSYISMKLYKHYNNKILNILFFIFMLTPAVIINNFYPLRLTMYAYLLLLFLSILFFDKLENKRINVLRFLELYILLPIILLWRSEGIIFAILTPVLIILTYFNKNKWSLKIGIFLVLLIFNLMIPKAYNKIIYKLDEGLKRADNVYSLTIFINPLSNMLNDNLKGENLEVNIENVDKVMDVELLKKHQSYVEIPSFWKEAYLVRGDFQDHLTDFKKSYIKIILNNPISFLKARIKTFSATMFMYEDYIGHIESVLIKYCENNSTTKVGTLNRFLNNYHYTKPINANLKYKFENTLLGENIATKWLKRLFILVFWNVIPIIIMSLLSLFLSFIKKDYFSFFIQESLIVYFIILFLTSPANYFMYYFPIYLVGFFFSIINLYELKLKNGKKNNKLLLSKTNH